ncbi:MAG TPA: AAA family ATPase [Gammaproteobacteria bacterium]|jgi:type II secretory pathway predicted ATPase ExeA
MYQDHFGLQRHLFEEGIAQGVDVFLGTPQKLAVTNLGVALTLRDSVALLTGPSGVGKTTLAAHTLRALTTRLALGWVGTAPVTGHELLEMLLTEFGFSPYKNSRVERLQMWRQYLNEMRATDTRVCVLVESAENLQSDVLAALESLTAADPNGCPGANVVLTSRTGLAELLAEPALAALRQRTRLRWNLEPLTRVELRDYLIHCITAAGGKTLKLFTDEAIDALHQYSGGIIRTANNLCATALTLAASAREPQVNAPLITQVAVDVFGLGPAPAVAGTPWPTVAQAEPSPKAASAPAAPPSPAAAPAPTSAAPRAVVTPAPAAPTPVVARPSSAASSLRVEPPAPAASVPPTAPAPPVVMPAPTPPRAVVPPPAAVSTPAATPAPAPTPTLTSAQSLAARVAATRAAQTAAAPAPRPVPSPKAAAPAPVPARGPASAPGGAAMKSPPSAAKSPARAPAPAPLSTAPAAKPPTPSPTPAPARSAAPPPPPPPPSARPAADVPVLTVEFESSPEVAADGDEEFSFDLALSAGEIDTVLGKDLTDVPVLTESIDSAGEEPSADDSMLMEFDEETQHKLANLEALANAKALEDISNSMAETLFGDAELDKLAATLALATGKRDEKAKDDEPQHPKARTAP